MENQNKIDAFEYFVSKLLDWYKDTYGVVKNNDLSTLKVLKLLFFCSAVNAEKDQKDTLLDFPFNNFFAMPYGHVESDIYDAIRKGKLSHLEINNETSIFNEEDFDYQNLDVKDKIDSSIKILRDRTHDQLIKNSSYELVELSHRWYSWKFYYNKAKKNGSLSEKIPVEIIKSENKFFHI